MRAFSLIELSMVLVILGLLTGGILTGQSLIRAAEIRSISTDWQRYEAALYGFRDKYFALPGDMAGATRFWPARDGGDGLGSDCTNLYAAGPETCNGNGDGVITGSWPETWLSWQHLANAGLIQGQYTGRSGGITAWHGIPGVNAPASKISTAFFFLATLQHPGDGGHFALDYGMYISHTIQDQTTANAIYVLNAEDAWNVDRKIDDGKPGLGRVIASANINNVTSCITATSSTDYNADYRLTIKDRCSRLFYRNIQ